MNLSTPTLLFSALVSLGAVLPQVSGQSSSATVSTANPETVSSSLDPELPDIPCDPRAQVVPYGAGWDGSFGVPSIAGPLPPARGGFFELQIGNSRGEATKGCLMIATSMGHETTRHGGSLMVDPLTITNLVPLDIPAAGLLHYLPVPEVTVATCRYRAYMQVVMLDPGATKGVSFTRGLMVQLGAEPNP